MKYYGDIELINGSIFGLHLESIESIDLTSVDSNRLIASDGKLYFNNGSGYKLLQFSDTDNESPLITTLGPWINNDLSFDPTPFNELNNVSDLTSDNSLLDVIIQLDQAITNINQDSLADLQDIVLATPEDADILIFSSGVFVNLSLEDAIENYGNVRLTSLQDYETVGVLLDNDLICWNSETENFNNKRCFYRYSSETSQTEYVLTHGLGVQYCVVEVFDKLTSRKLNTSTYDVLYTSDNTVEITLNSATVAEIVVFSL